MTKTAETLKPLYATVGAGDAIYTAVLDLVSQAQSRAKLDNAREQFAKLPADVQTQLHALRERLAGLPSDPAELRAKLTPEELRKTADSYVQQALDLYGELATRGEGTVDKLRDNGTLDRAEGIYKEAVSLAEEAVTKFAEQAKTVVDRVSGKVDEATAPAPEPESTPAPEPEPAKTAARKTTKKKVTDTDGAPE